MNDSNDVAKAEQELKDFELNLKKEFQPPVSSQTKVQVSGVQDLVVPSKEITERKTSGGFKKVFLGILFLILLLGIVGGAYYLGISKDIQNSRVTTLPTSVPDISITITPTLQIITTPAVTLNISDDWQTYLNTEFVYTNSVYKSYSLKYPPSCDRVVSTLSCKLAHGEATLIINAGGHGGEQIETKVIKSNETKVIAVGEGKVTEIEDVKAKTVFGTYWINKTKELSQEPIFGFEFNNIPAEDLQEFDILFDQLLATLKFEV